MLVGASDAGAADFDVAAGAWVEAGASLVEVAEADFALEVLNEDELDDVELLSAAALAGGMPSGQAQSGGVPGIRKVGVVYGKCVLGSPVGDDEWFQMIVIVKSNTWFELLLLSARKTTSRHWFAASAIGKLGLA
ncbi:hypothetical protein EU513_03610 [Yimella sp. RIT 621]|uniref:hypothetical protein n=1 Tax=Yimella sp. RIT 621 TaxID=2510323 RepID=UPI00101D441A|nr:hypothetical protein [Yimella sp. RIT 621]RYG78158.1 hypothetical protein EU513_03610 [Yimella sp. RIT 621]